MSEHGSDSEGQAGGAGDAPTGAEMAVNGSDAGGERGVRQIGWLHFTDLHVDQPKEGGRLPGVERALLGDLERVIGGDAVMTGGLPIDVVFFTGDIAFKGADEEYLKATAFLGRVLRRIARCNAAQGIEEALATPILCVVPGNHDLERPEAEVVRRIRHAFRQRTPCSRPLWQDMPRDVQTAIEAAFARGVDG
ncbi:MAG: metallophosphoesterase [Myxococcales bacterium]|nr:metallophosphoesterase [Myxococcales bacterium]